MKHAGLSSHKTVPKAIAIIFPELGVLIFNKVSKLPLTSLLAFLGLCSGFLVCVPGHLAQSALSYFQLKTYVIQAQKLLS
jgi:hypothetical protein